MNYKKIDLTEAYRFFNSGAVVLVSTADINGTSDITPIAWTCPLDYDPVTKIIFVLAKEHKSTKNILENRLAVFCIPSIEQLEMVKKTGSISGHNTNKFKTFGIASRLAKTSSMILPDDCIAYAEAQIFSIIEEEFSYVFFAEITDAYAEENSFDGTYTLHSKTIHHLGKGKFFTPGEMFE